MSIIEKSYFGNRYNHSLVCKVIYLQIFFDVLTESLKMLILEGYQKLNHCSIICKNSFTLHKEIKRNLMASTHPNWM